MSQRLIVHIGREEEEGKAKFFLPPVNFQSHSFSWWRTVFHFFWAEVQVVSSEQNLLLWMWSWENLRGAPSCDFSQGKSSETWLVTSASAVALDHHQCHAGSVESRAKSFLPHTRNSQTESFPWDVLSSRVIPVKMNALLLPRHVSYLCEKWKLREVM